MYDSPCNNMGPRAQIACKLPGCFRKPSGNLPGLALVILLQMISRLHVPAIRLQDCMARLGLNSSGRGWALAPTVTMAGHATCQEMLRIALLLVEAEKEINRMLSKTSFRICFPEPSGNFRNSDKTKGRHKLPDNLPGSSGTAAK